MSKVDVKTCSHGAIYPESVSNIVRTYGDELRIAKAEIARLKALVEKADAALEMFDNRRKLAYSLRSESPPVAAFVEAMGVQIDAIRYHRDGEGAKE